MIEIDIHMPHIDDPASVIARVEAAARRHGLTQQLKSSLRSYPGSVHWHFTNGQSPGTLEVTYWPAKCRLWFKVQPNRSAEWVHELVPGLRDELERSPRTGKG